MRRQSTYPQDQLSPHQQPHPHSLPFTSTSLPLYLSSSSYLLSTTLSLSPFSLIYPNFLIPHLLQQYTTPHHTPQLSTRHSHTLTQHPKQHAKPFRIPPQVLSSLVWLKGLGVLMGAAVGVGCAGWGIRGLGVRGWTG